SCGSVTTSAAPLTVNVPPIVTANPSGQTGCTGTTVTFIVAGSGTPVPTYQWRRGGVNINGATGTSVAIGPLSAADAGAYDCVLTNACGSTPSSAASLTVNMAPTVTTNPSNREVCAGGSTSFSAAGNATPAPSF